MCRTCALDPITRGASEGSLAPRLIHAPASLRPLLGHSPVYLTAPRSNLLLCFHRVLFCLSDLSRLLLCVLLHKLNVVSRLPLLPAREAGERRLREVRGSFLVWPIKPFLLEETEIVDVGMPEHQVYEGISSEQLPEVRVLDGILEGSLAQLAELVDHEVLELPHLPAREHVSDVSSVKRCESVVSRTYSSGSSAAQISSNGKIVAT